MSPKAKGRDYTWLLTFGAALVVVIRYAAAFTASDMGQMTGLTSKVTTFLMAVSGIGMGFLVVFGQLYAFDGWKRSMPNTKQKVTFRFLLLTLVSVLLIVMDVAILVPFTVSRIRQESISAVLGVWDWLWSTAVNIAPALLLSGVALGNQIVSTTQTATTQNVGNLPETYRKEGAVSWRQVRKNLDTEAVRWISTARTEEICFRYGVDDRTARNWRKYAQANKQ